jgi:hypothetical protein
MKPGFFPAGDYEVQVVNATGYIAAEGNKVVILKLSIEGGCAKTFDVLVFTPKGMPKIAAFFAAIQIKLADGEGIAIADLTGRSGRARVKVALINHRFRNVITRWLPKRGAMGQ